MPPEFSRIMPSAFHVLSATGTIDWNLSFHNAIEFINNEKLIYGSRIVLLEQEYEKLKNTITSQALELTELKSKIKRASDEMDPNDEPGTSQQASGEPRAKKKKTLRLPHYPIVFNQKADGNATEPVVRILIG